MLDKERAKEELLKLVSKEKRTFHVLLDQYHQKESPSVEEYAELNAHLIQSLERIKALYDSCHGGDSLFLKNTIAPLLEALSDAKSKQAALADTNDAPTQASGDFDAVPHECERVYIVLYQADGANLSKWVLQLLSLNKLLATRPVYRNEADARQACRSTTETMTKGYISVIVKKTSIMNDELAARRKDQHGRALVLLKDGALSQGNQIEYLALGREKYRWIANQLLPIIE